MGISAGKTSSTIRYPLERLEARDLLTMSNSNDYSEADENLTFRMAGTGHELIQCELTMKISQGLADAAARNDNPHSTGICLTTYL